MIDAFSKKLTVFIVPALLLVAAYFCIPRIGSLPSPWKELIPYLPFATIAVGMFLSLHFHRGRVLFVLLLLAILSWNCSHYLNDGLTDFSQRMIFQALCLLLPLNIGLFCFMRERGVLTVGGRLRLIFLALQAALVAWLVRFNYTGVEALLQRRLVNSPFLDALPFSQSTLFFIAIALLLMLIRVLVRKSPIDSGLLATAVAVVLTCALHATPDAPFIFVTAGALILTLSVLQDTHNMAFRDDLTGLQSRRALNEQLMGLGRQYAVAMVDVDHFKRFNDTYGHDVGDQVLKMVAVKIEGVRGGGKAFRYGGEEFTVIFPRKKAADVMHHLEELRKVIAGYNLWLRSPERPKKQNEGKNRRTGGGGDISVSVTVSIGVAESKEGQTPSDVIRAADQALYRAKHKGRNRVCS